MSRKNLIVALKKRGDQRFSSDFPQNIVARKICLHASYGGYALLVLKLPHSDTVVLFVYSNLIF